MAVLSVTNLAKAYDGVQALRGVSFAVDAGELVAMIGPNGAGKTTCFNIVNGQLPPDAGNVTLDGTSLLGMPPREIWRLGVGRTFQVAATFGSMSVRENVQVALLSDRRLLNSFFRSAGNLFIREADELLNRVALGEQAGRVCAELAYGDLKRLELAIALANRPRLLLMDEPTAGTAPKERDALMGLVSTLARGEKITTSIPLAFIIASWFFSIDSRSSSSLMTRSDAFGIFEGSVMPAICRLRHSSSAGGEVV
jgi:branched-chain amino acid transport system ATP-binding protein